MILDEKVKIGWEREVYGEGVLRIRFCLLKRSLRWNLIPGKSDGY
jgi:hypothetical protein